MQRIWGFDVNGDASGRADLHGRPTHIPVLLDHVVDLLVPALESAASAGRQPVVVDCTLGLGGHSEALLSRVPELRLVGLDRDPQALELSRKRLSAYDDRVTYVHAVYHELPDVLERLGLTSVHGILLDLGVSSLQLDEADRGFAYSRDVALDMRMDPTRGLTAADVLNTYPAADLRRILRDFGEERFAGRIADAIVAARATEPFTTSARLVSLLHDAVPRKSQLTGGHPAKRTFQALRIEVNGELASLDEVLPSAIDALAVGGRIVVLAYHSLEDRRVKRTLAALARPDIPEGVPSVPPGHEAVVRLLTRGAVQASPDEAAANPRAKPARLRAAERLAGGAARTLGRTGATP